MPPPPDYIYIEDTGHPRPDRAWVGQGLILLVKRLDTEYLVKTIELRHLFLYSVLVKDRMRETQIPNIWETGEEKGLSIGQLKYRYLQVAKHNFQGRVFFNKNTGKPIRVSQDGLMEWWRKSRKREHILSVQALDFFLENAVFIEENPDYKNRPEIEHATRFESGCKVNGKPFKVVVTTRKGAGNIEKFRYYSLKEIKMAPK